MISSQILRAGFMRKIIFVITNNSGFVQGSSKSALLNFRMTDLKANLNRRESYGKPKPDRLGRARWFLMKQLLIRSIVWQKGRL